MSNYPPGAANDPKAPYNQSEPEFEECPDCCGEGKIYFDDDEEWEKETCPRCLGDGEIEVTND